MAGLLRGYIMKRIFDIFFASFSLVCLIPFFLLIVIAIYVFLGSPILFKQQRPGYKGSPFIIYKFRTMTNEKDKAGEYLLDNMRMTTVGHFLRRFSLDELPQLFNVLKGELSVVGPRPLLMEYIELYTPRQERRHEVKPGITGWAQINGRNALSWEERFELDVWYVEHESFWLDMKIIVLTILNVIRGDGVSQEGHITMPKFGGTKLG
jgi:sugar transferase EpsL